MAIIFMITYAFVYSACDNETHGTAEDIEHFRGCNECFPHTEAQMLSLCEGQLGLLSWYIHIFSVTDFWNQFS